MPAHVVCLNPNDLAYAARHENLIWNKTKMAWEPVPADGRLIPADHVVALTRTSTNGNLSLEQWAVIPDPPGNQAGGWIDIFEYNASSQTVGQQLDAWPLFSGTPVTVLMGGIAR